MSVEGTHMASDESVLVEVDPQRRVSLGNLGDPDHIRYLASVESDGTIVLRPAGAMTEQQARLLNNPELVEIRDQHPTPEMYIPHSV